MTPENPNQAVPVESAAGASGTNPIAGAASITLSLPESVEVKLVDASALGDYEIWVLLTSILSSAVIGFLVASTQAKDDQRALYVMVTVVFAVLMIVCGIMAFTKRRRIGNKARRIKFRIGEPMPME